MFAVDVVKLHLFFAEHEFDFSSGAVTMFANVDVGDAGSVAVFFVIVFTVHHKDNIGILFDRTGFTKVGELGNFSGAVFDSTRKLGECDDGNMEFAGKVF